MVTEDERVHFGPTRPSFVQFGFDSRAHGPTEFQCCVDAARNMLFLRSYHAL